MVKMSEKTIKTDISMIDSAMEIMVSKPKKNKHNSKRRNCKKSQPQCQLPEDPNISQMDEVVNYLCNTISKNDSEATAITNPSILKAKESPKQIGSCSGQNHQRTFVNFNQVPTTSAENLSYLLESLQVIQTNKKSSGLKVFLDPDFLKKHSGEMLSAECLEKSMQEESKKQNRNKNKAHRLNEVEEEYFNLSLYQQLPENSLLVDGESYPMPLISESDQSSYSSISETDENIENSGIACYKSNTQPKLVTSKKLVKCKKYLNDYDKVVTKIESPGKNKKVFKKKNKGQKDSFKEETGIFGNQKMSPNSGSHQKKCLNEDTSSESPQTKVKKKQQSLKNSPKNDTKFPKYLNSEELQSISNFGVLLTGIIRINQKNYKEAYITAPDKGMDILIEGLKDRNRALEGDEVYFVLKAKEHHRASAVSTEVQRTAVVVGIKTLNHNRGAIGTLNLIKNRNDNFAVFSPRDWRLPRIRIKRANWPLGFPENYENFKDRLYFAKIVQWNDLRFADGEIIKEVGLVGNIEAETKALLLKYELDVEPYSEELKKFLPSPGYRIPEIEIKKREDLRKECIFTIDPATAVDLDDAVSCKMLPNGNYQVGVHISDVSYFLTEGTPLDEIVAQRATTVYLVQKAYHMLPYELCQLCSLLPGGDRLAFSVIWEISPQYKIINHRFARTIINSCAQFSYDQVQSIITNAPSDKWTFPKIHGNHSTENIKEIILFLYKMAMYLRSQRFSNGALKIEKKKIIFLLDDNRMPKDYIEEVNEESHQLIEEFMLLANITVAERLIEVFPKIAFLRCHSPPLAYILEKIQKSLEKYGIILDISTAESLHTSLLKYSGDDTESLARMLVLNNTIAKPMARAKYYCSGMCLEEEERRHYALNVPLYTHFTSPLRRYADIMTHRLLAAAMNYCECPRWSPEFVQSIASNCNKQKYAAKMAQEMSIELFLSVYIGLKGPTVFEAVICDIKDKSFDCIVLSTGAHQRLYFEHIKGKLLLEKEDGIMRLTIIWPPDKSHECESIQIIEMFSIVKIEMKRTNGLKIEAKLLRYN